MTPERGNPERTDDRRHEWSLREGVTFLNHGSFGLLPKCVQAAQREWRDQIAAERILYDAEASAMLSRPYREPWTLD